VPELTIARIDVALQALTGRIRQRPPIYSALKRGGEPLYAKARRGEAVEVEEREVDVHAFELQSAADLLDGLLENGAPPLLRLHVECGSGTYVRSLVRDLGELLGCGAHVAELRRLWVDPFREPRMWTLEALQALAERGERSLDACLLPIESGMSAWPEVRVAAAQALRLGRGQGVGGDFRPPGSVAIVDESGRALGLGEVGADGSLRPQRLFAWAAQQVERTHQ
jgi:tRNA pseudouridine55 synthase